MKINILPKKDTSLTFSDIKYGEFFCSITESEIQPEIIFMKVNYYTIVSFTKEGLGIIEHETQFHVNKNMKVYKCVLEEITVRKV